MITLVNALLAIAVSASPAALPQGYGSGRFAAEGRVWEIALDVPGGDPEAIRIDMPSLWRMGEPVPALSVRGDSVAFDLLWDMGRVEARRVGDAIEGTARLRGGPTVPLRLRRGTRPATPRVVLSYPSGSTGDRHSWRKGWHGRVADYDPAPALRRATAPMLWVYGVEDGESDIVRNVEVLETLRARFEKPYTIATFPGAGHGILVPVTDDGVDRPPLTAAPGFFDTVTGWMDARVGVR